MVSIFPVGFFLLPAAILASLREEWATYFAISSIPFFALKPVVAVGHPVTFPELAILSVLINQCIQWSRDQVMRFPVGGPVLWLWGFLAISVLSVIYTVVHPPFVIVHPYNSGPIDENVLRQFQVSSTAITQLLLRLFTVGAITLLVIRLSMDQIIVTIRYLLISSVVVGVIGMGYQLSAILNLDSLILLVIDFGFTGIRLDFSQFGPIPRMYSLPGEPGYVAHFLLYGVSVSAAIVALPDPSIFNRRDASVLLVLLTGLLILTTSTTGYGGLLVLIGVLLFTGFLFTDFKINRVIHIFLPFLIILPIILGIVFTRIEYIELIRYQVEKLQFEEGSGPIRLQYLLMALELAADRPVLGTGVGSHYGASVIGTILAESGLVGLGTFFGLLVSTFRDSVRLAGAEEGVIREMAIILTVAGATIWLTALVAKSITALLFPWAWFSIAMPIVLILRARGALNS